MMNALLMMALLGQDADVAVTGHGRRHGGDYDLTVSGKGRGLQDQEMVTLKFRRIANRLIWEEGSLVTVPVDDEISRAAAVEKNEFVHHESFPVAGEVEVSIGRAPEEHLLRHRFRVSTLPEEAHAIGSSAKRFDSALRGLRLLLGDIEGMKGEMCPAARKQAQLQKRIDWRRDAYRREVADSFLTASAHAMTLLMADIDSAMDLERAGKDATAMMSSLTGMPFSWEEASAQIDALETVSLRERALLIVKALQEIGARLRPGSAASAIKEVTRTIDALEQHDQAWRSGPLAGSYGSLVEVDGASLDGLLAQARSAVQAVEDADLVRVLQEQSGLLESRLRSMK